MHSHWHETYGIWKESKLKHREFLYLEIKLESTEEWNTEKENIKIKGMQTLGATDKCWMKAPNTKLQILWYKYQMKYELLMEFTEDSVTT